MLGFVDERIGFAVALGVPLAEHPRGKWCPLTCGCQGPSLDPATLNARVLEACMSFVVNHCFYPSPFRAGGFRYLQTVIQVQESLHPDHLFRRELSFLVFIRNYVGPHMFVRGKTLLQWMRDCGDLDGFEEWMVTHGACPVGLEECAPDRTQLRVCMPGVELPQQRARWRRARPSWLALCCVR